ncbi:MAG: energy transducer TonB [Phycisphaerae bacterium]
MIHKLLSRPRSSAAYREVAARSVIRLGSWTIPLPVIAWGLSALFHGGLLIVSYYATWRPARVTEPAVAFAKGAQATRIEILLTPWPAPVEEEPKKEDAREDATQAEPLLVPSLPEEVVVVSPPEEVAPDVSVDPPVLTHESPDPLVENWPDPTEPQVAEETLDFQYEDYSVEAMASTEEVQAMVERLLDRLDALLSPSDAKDRDVGPPPSLETASDESAAPPRDDTIQPEASSSQTTGVETGVETIDLPTPKYPFLSRRQGEEGLVLLQVEVLADGTVGDVVVLRDAGFRRLTEAAIAAVRKGRFQPATRDGRPIRATVRIPFRFVLK